MEVIKSYYRLCSVKNPQNSQNPVIMSMHKDELANLFGKKTDEIIDKDRNTIKDNIVGGKGEKKIII